MIQNDTDYMQMAIAIAIKGNTPFGALLVDNQGNSTAAHNTSKTDGPTAHAEMNVLHRMKELTLDDKSEMSLYTTVEPCPMCMSAIIWAGIGKVVFGASVADAKKYGKQIEITAEEVARKSWYTPQIIGGVLRHECINLFEK